MPLKDEERASGPINNGIADIANARQCQRWDGEELGEERG